MWTLAFAFWVAFKTLAWIQAGSRRPRGSRLAAYLLWPGMDAATFHPKLASRPTHFSVVSAAGILPAAARTFLGAGLLLAAARLPIPTLAAGWLGMTGLILTLHFGLFDLLALFWNRLGVPVRRIMDAPWRSHHLSEFWGKRWNRGFSDVARWAVFQPVARRLGLPAAILAGFAFSGIVHEAVLSLPAGGGFGGPLLYFLIQGSGICLLRRSRPRLRPDTRRVLTALVLIGPVFWLFHPPFLEKVFVPFLLCFLGE
jgi:alginate O-acetyltransferase complex protein AlgI